MDQSTFDTVHVFETHNLWSVGTNCGTIANWNNPGLYDLTIPCHIPSGNYWLRVEIDNVDSSTNDEQLLKYIKLGKICLNKRCMSTDHRSGHQSGLDQSSRKN